MGIRKHKNMREERTRGQKTEREREKTNKKVDQSRRREYAFTNIHVTKITLQWHTRIFSLENQLILGQILIPHRSCDADNIH